MFLIFSNQVFTICTGGYALGFVELSACFRLKYATMSSFDILESFSLNFSR